MATSIYDNILVESIRKLKSTVHFVIEAPYVDSMYRDSYYSYFATKLKDYKKDCIRLSFFDGQLTVNDFREQAGLSTLQERYRGFMVLRPTVPSVIGRSVISPEALQDDDFLCLTSSYPSSVHSVKLVANGFPHSSQDAEMISCAETSIWAIMEYFSSRYADYRPAPPSMIMDVLKNRSNVRQIPTEGLQTGQIGFAIREFGLATKIYSRRELGDAIFRQVFSTYTESGLPLVVAMDNDHQIGNVAHALIAIGRARTTDELIDNLAVTEELNPYFKSIINHKGIQFFDNDDIPRKFVFIDDNMPPYQLQHFETPALHYNEPDWNACRISEFIAPLHPRMYLEAVAAKIYIKEVLLGGTFAIGNGAEIFLRLFLTSSRSYKDYLVRDARFKTNIGEYIMEMLMPEFIWVAEISDKANIKQKQAFGLFILDATEPNINSDSTLIFGGYKNVFIDWNGGMSELVKNCLDLDSFSIYVNNLKDF
ncbi:hypothetical protein [Chitinophaga filiformis]|uniref:hypothetical protein n=1 Tax=Chitinophaga filiformis TaxID=104663 RepID=UPI001F3C7601|nr:hypothetical protein [Chitinophaga filiformis]